MIVLLAGGVGGAKLADGLAAVLAPEELVVAVNTGDDAEHFGLLVSPDIDTVSYTLAGLSDPGRGWGLADESWTFMEQVAKLGGPDWFCLGDRDLALKAERTRRLAAGQTLSEVTADLAAALGVAHTIVPMSDDPVRTFVDTDEGRLAFHNYFVRRRCEPRLTGLHFAGAEQAQAAPGLMAALADPALEAILIAPSNPWLSIAPILAVPGVREAVTGAGVPVVAVSPIVAGAAIKGPAAKIMGELGLPVSARGVADHYRGLIDGLAVDRGDLFEADGAIALLPTDAIMRDRADRARLAGEVLAFARGLN